MQLYELFDNFVFSKFTSKDDNEIKDCIKMLPSTDNEPVFMHESFNVNDASDFTREWFAKQNTLFGELIPKLIADGNNLHYIEYS